MSAVVDLAERIDKQLKVAEAFRLFGAFTGDEIFESARHLRRFLAAFSFQLHRHHRRRCLADGASLPAELYLLQFAVGPELDAEMNFIAAGRVIAVHHHIRFLQHAKISRPSRMIENDFLVKLFEVHAQAKKRAASRRISIIRSISSVVL